LIAFKKDISNWSKNIDHTFIYSDKENPLVYKKAYVTKIESDGLIFKYFVGLID
jgi:hypothetical protein